ncbi:MAG: hypothetical protein ACKPKO_19215, partial [Candidatus Fonsibacter sp.]
ALSAEKEVSLAAFNAGVAKGMKKALCAINKRHFFPYYKWPDADLWKVIWQLLQKHGEEAVKVRWTKAHATQHHIQQGATTEWDSRQNAEADAAADE